MEADEKKERVIHMRVEPSLDSELKDRAGKLGLSVSNLVRNILQHTFGLAGDVLKDGAQVARSARGEPLADDPGGPLEERTHERQRPAKVLGWQRFTLSLNALCEQCNGILPKGSEAAIGVLDGPGKRPVTCITCAEEPSRG